MGLHQTHLWPRRIPASMCSPVGAMPRPAASWVCPPAWVLTSSLGMKNSCPASRPAQTMLPRAPSSLYTDLGARLALGCQPADRGGHSHGAEDRAFTAAGEAQDRQRGWPWGVALLVSESDDQGLNPGYVTPSLVPWVAGLRSLSPAGQDPSDGAVEGVSGGPCRWQVLTSGPHRASSGCVGTRA